jgi:hypothetical protein
VIATSLAAAAFVSSGCARDLPSGWLYVTGISSTGASIVWTGDAAGDVRCDGGAGGAGGGAHEPAQVVARGRGLWQASFRQLHADTEYTCRISLPASSSPPTVPGGQSPTRDRDRGRGGGGRRVRFRTAPAADIPVTFTFAAVGDSGDGGRAAASIARRILAARPAFLVHLGDLAYPDGTATDLDGHFFRPYRRVLERVPLFPTPGNHDLDTDSAYTDLFLPLYDSAEPDDLNYAFDWGDARFLSASSTAFADPEVVNASWLGSELANAAARPWRIVFLHEPPYTSARKGSVVGGRWLQQILERGRADLVLAGHVHMYERADLACTVEAAARVLSIVSGGGGDASLDQPRPHPNFVRALSVPHFLRLRVSRDSIDVWAVDTRGRVLDHTRHRRDLEQPCRRRGWWWVPEAREGAENASGGAGRLGRRSAP